ncbi:MAG: sugar transferase, partial [Pseudomonadota bacterium]
VTTPIVLTLAFTMSAAHGFKEKPFYEQERIGLDGRPFIINKIRSMREIYDDEGHALPDEDRVTKIGILLRKSRLDELPQLYNILKGDMSFVGPRPVTTFQKLLANDNLRNSVRPGLTGLAQINDKNSKSPEEILSLDHKYIKHQSFGLDLKIMLQTPISLWKNRKSSHYRPAAQMKHAKFQ